MIHEIWNPTRPSFKRLRFRPGLNIVSVRRTDGSANTGKRNAAGKSSLIDIFHFMFGGSREAGSPLSAPELATDAFKLACDVAGTRIVVSRSLESSNKIAIEGDFRSLPRQPEVNEKTGEVTFTNDAWCDVLGQAMFNMPSATSLGSGEFLSFRSCFPYFARRQRSGAYLDWRRNFVQQRPVAWQVSLAYLFGLDREGPLELHRVKEAEKQKSSLERLLKSEFAAKIPTSGRLKMISRRLQRQIERLEGQLNGYKVIDFYDDLVDEANRIQTEIDEMSNANILDGELINDLSAALKQERPPAIPDLVQLYEQAGVVLKETVVKRYDEVEEFHRAIVANRVEHLKAELDDAKARVDARRAEMVRKSERRNTIMQSLDTGGALLQYRKLEGQLVNLRSEHASVQRQLELAEKIDELRMDLRVRRAEAERRIKQDVAERRELVEEAGLIFDEISQQLYDTPAAFDIVAGREGLDFKIDAPEIASDGIKQVQIFTFDMTLATVCARRNAWPGFLIHDSHIFDGVDGRQIAIALQVADRIIRDLGGQYIVTMNSDDLEKAEREGDVSFNDFIVEPELDDSPTGCLFGFRFATPDDPLDRQPTE